MSVAPLAIPERFLVADVGGTNARFAIAERQAGAGASGFRLHQPRKLSVAEFENFGDAIANYLATVGMQGARLRGACLAVASAVGIGEIQFTNSPWRFSRETLASRFELDKLLIVNDFEALALQVPYCADNILQICRAGEEHAHAPRVVVGPGTGLGVAGLVPMGRDAGRFRWHVVPGEGGHIAFAPNNDIEIEILRALRESHGRVSVERIASGPGLTAVYRFLCARSGVPAADDAPSAISERALARADALAIDAVQIFLGVVGGFAGDAALMFGAVGGVYLGGGILPRLAPLLHYSDFFVRFNQKGRYAAWMEKIPVRMILDDHAALLGAAVALDYHEALRL